MIYILVHTESVYKLIEVLLLSSIKFIFAPPLSLEFGFNWFQTIILTTIGGILGVIFFFYLSEGIFTLLKILIPNIKKIFKRLTITKKHQTLITETPDVSKKKSFTRKNKFIINTRKRYGLWGIAAITPIFLSIPIGTFLANKYYPNKKNVILILSASVACWSFLMSSVYFLL